MNRLYIGLRPATLGNCSCVALPPASTVVLFRTLCAVHGVDPVWMLDGPGEQPVKAATRTIDLALADRVITGLETDPASMGRKLSQAERLRVLKAAYALSAAMGRLDVSGIKQLLEVVLRR